MKESTLRMMSSDPQGTMTSLIRNKNHLAATVKEIAISPVNQASTFYKPRRFNRSKNSKIREEVKSIYNRHRPPTTIGNRAFVS